MNPDLGDAEIRAAGSGGVFDVGAWKSSFGRFEVDEGKVAITRCDPPIAGVRLVVGGAGDQTTLTLHDAQVTYVFEHPPPSPEAMALEDRRPSLVDRLGSLFPFLFGLAQLVAFRAVEGLLGGLRGLLDAPFLHGALDVCVICARGAATPLALVFFRTAAGLGLRGRSGALCVVCHTRLPKQRVSRPLRAGRSNFRPSYDVASHPIELRPRSWLRDAHPAEAYQPGESTYHPREPTVTTPSALVLAVRRELRRVAVPEKASAMQAYMKSAMPYMGVPMPALRSSCKELFAAFPLASAEAWRDHILSLWRGAEHREERYAAIELAGDRRARAFQTIEALPMYEEMIVTGAWWDYVDPLASHRVGELVGRYPRAMKRVMRSWSRADDLWKRRSSILCQLHFKDETDIHLLYACIEPSIGRPEFFLRKAIGWALRQYAWTDAAEVMRYVAENESRLSGLSKREALKNCARAG